MAVDAVDVHVTQHPEVRDKFRWDATPKRVPIKTMNKAKLMEVNIVL
jgi:hypothetical protein